jgi:MurNAc alpha-1-phosphate uridylyltransferase
MQCLILAGGLGTRMKTVTGERPKALLHIGDKTFIHWQLSWLKLLGVTKVILALGHGGEMITEHLEGEIKTSAFPKLEYQFDGEKLLGTGGAIKKAQSHLDKDFIVTYGDSFTFINLNDFKKSHEKSKQPLTLSIFKNEDQGDKSNVVFENGLLKKYSKKDLTHEMKYIDYGLSYINKDYFLKNTPDGTFDLADFISKTCETRSANAYVTKFIFQQVGSVEGYENFKRILEANDYDLKILAHETDLI